MSLVFLLFLIGWGLFSFIIPDILIVFKIDWLLFSIPFDLTRSFILSIWQVQAGISLVAFTVVSLIVGKLDFKIFGISIKTYILDDVNIFKAINPIYKSTNIKNSVLVALGLLLFNYLNFYLNTINGAIYTLAITFIVIFSLVRSIFAILLEEAFIKSKIKKSYLENVDKLESDIKFSIENLAHYMTELITADEYRKYNNNLHFFNTLAKAIYNKVELEDDYSTENLKKSITIISNRLYKINNKIELMEFLNNMIGLDSKYSGKMLYELYKPLRELIISIRNISTIEELNRINIYEYLNNELENIYMSKSQYFRDYYSFITGLIYSVRENNILDENDKKSYIRKILNENSNFLYLKNKADKKTQIKKEKSYAIIRSIIKTDKFSFLPYLEYYIKRLIINNRLGTTNKNTEINIHYEIIFTLFVYSYYVVFYDEFDEDYRKKFRRFLKGKINIDGGNDLSIFQDLIFSKKEYIWQYYVSIKEELKNNNWEKMPINTVKTMIMPKPVKDFFVYLSEVILNEKIDLQVLDALDYYEIVNLMKYYEKGEIKNDKKLNEFCNFFELQDKYSDSKVSYLYLGLQKKLKSLEIENVQNATKNEKNINNKIEELKNKYIEDLQETYFYDEKIENGKTQKITDRKVDIISLKRNKELYEDHMIRAIEMSKKLAILDMCNKTPYKINLNEEENCAIKLLDFIEKVEEKPIKLDSIIGTSLKEIWNLKYNSTEKEYGKIESFDDRLEKIETNFGYPIIILEKAKEKIKIKAEKIEFRRYTREEVLSEIKEYKNDDGEYDIPTIDNIKLKMIEDEAVEYFRKRYLYLSVTMMTKTDYVSDDIICLNY
ncbi:MAG: hypothetical protein ACQEQI_02410 [Bacillota bacterium]